jgi:hypothetical protein
MVVEGTAVGGMSVGEAGICVGTSVTGISVFVGTGAGFVGVLTLTDMSHARDTRINSERVSKAFFIVGLPFWPEHTHET